MNSLDFYIECSLQVFTEILSKRKSMTNLRQSQTRLLRLVKFGIIRRCFLFVKKQEKEEFFFTFFQTRRIFKRVVGGGAPEIMLRIVVNECFENLPAISDNPI